MAPGPEPELNVAIVPASTLPTQPWWKDLHETINMSFQNKEGVKAYPPTWTRLPSDPKEGAERLRDELGPNGIIAVVHCVNRPTACVGALPFRGLNWINAARSAGEPESSVTGDLPETPQEVAYDQKQNLALESQEGDFEICCLCTHPLHRGIGMSKQIMRVLEDALKKLGAKRLFANYVIEESGRYWPKMGYETIPGAGGVLKKGFTHTEGMEPLREDLHFAMGVKTLS